MKCEECGHETNEQVCKNCGLVIDDKPIALGGNAYPSRRWDITTLHAAEMHGWDSPLSPKTRKKGFGKTYIKNPKYQGKYEDYVYVKAHEGISKLCAQLKLLPVIKFEALNLFKGIRKIDPDFFKKNKLAPAYLACIKIACKINDYPIMNYQLAEVIDYRLAKDKKNVSYMERKFNRAYKEILRLYNLKIKTPEHPRFIDYACNILKTSIPFARQIHESYTVLRKYFQPHFRIEGYILALIYIRGRKEYKFTLKMLEVEFHTSSLTISNRKNEIAKILEKVKKNSD